MRRQRWWQRCFVASAAQLPLAVEVEVVEAEVGAAVWLWGGGAVADEALHGFVAHFERRQHRRRRGLVEGLALRALPAVRDAQQRTLPLLLLLLLLLLAPVRKSSEGSVFLVLATDAHKATHALERSKIPTATVPFQRGR